MVLQLETHQSTVASPGAALMVRPLSSAIGAEVLNTDLRVPLSQIQISALRDVWHRYAVVLFRNQELTDEEQARFGEYFGDLRIVKRFRPNPRKIHPAVLYISNIREDGTLIGSLPDGEVQFHSDEAYTGDPPVGTMLYGIEIPSVGGNTVFANMYSAYDTLTQAVKERIEGLSARNVYDLYNADGAPAVRMAFSADSPSFVHPVVTRHPVTKRKVLFVNRLMTAKIEGLSTAESDDLLNFLFSHQEKPQFIYEHVWRKGDLILWDNRCTLHARTDFNANERRLLRRMTVQSERQVTVRLQVTESATDKASLT
jgi:taurine dioxygenase